MKNLILKPPVVSEFAVCEQCGYDGGFHVVFRRAVPGTGMDLVMLLKCPDCRQEYSIGLVAPLAEGRK
jgi:hypothetical protein